MKIGFRRPSIAGRIAARTSWKRLLRHNLGLKAPRGLGWITDPKKALYNRIYSRTTVDPVELAARQLRRAHGGGSLVGLVAGAFAAAAVVIFVVLVVAGVVS